MKPNRRRFFTIPRSCDDPEQTATNAASGQDRSVGSLLQFSGSFAVLSRKRSSNLRRRVFSPDRLQCSGIGHWP